jgi:hypothetical protein
MDSLKNSLSLQNQDLRWYRDKYLGAIFLVSFLVAMSLLWQWPLPHEELVRSCRFLGVAALCLLATPQRLIILTGPYPSLPFAAWSAALYIIQLTLEWWALSLVSWFM